MTVLLACALEVMGIAALFGMGTDFAGDAVLSLAAPARDLRSRAERIRGKRKAGRIGNFLFSLKSYLDSAGRKTAFAAACCAAPALGAAGIALCSLAGNMFLAIPVVPAFAALPFLFLTLSRDRAKRKLSSEMESALGVITSSYIRTDDLVVSVRENLPYIKEPLRKIFEEFVAEATEVSSSVREAIVSMSGKTGDRVFAEWCGTLVRCQDDRIFKDTLPMTVSMLADRRAAASESAHILSAAGTEFLTMCALVAGNAPILYLINREWFYTLTCTLPGKMTCAFCAAVIAVTAALAVKFIREGREGR